MKKVAGYLVGGKPIAEQKNAITKHCEANQATVVEWIDGKKIRLTDLAYGAVGDLKKFDAVVLVDNCGLKENIYEFYACKYAFQKRRIELVALRTRFAGYDLYKKILDEFLSTVIRLDAENAPVQETGRREELKAAGAYVGGQAPMGYKVEDGRLVVNENEVPVVLFIMQRKREGKTMTGTVDALNEEGFQSRKGNKFVISTVQSIWKNEPFYRGMAKNGDEWIPGQHEAILKD